MCTVASALLVDFFKEHVPFLSNQVDKLSRYIVTLLNIQYDYKYLSILLYATLLAIIWGVAFSFIHKDKSS